jgi:hypothetical protein
MRILVFLHGTVLMHPSALGATRAERVDQVRDGDPMIRDYAAYLPVGEALAKLRRWHDSGAQIDYLSSHSDPDHVATDGHVLRNWGFPAGRVLARQSGESYGDVAGREAPDVLIEDDCESIGADQVTYPQIPPAVRARIKSIIVPEFGGIDHLPDDPQALLRWLSPPAPTSPETAQSPPGRPPH